MCSWEIIMLKYLFAAIIIIVLVIVNVLRNKISKDTLFVLKTVLIVILLEVTVFNINSYRTDLGNLKYTEFTGDELKEITLNTLEDTKYVSIENLNTKVKSIYLELSNLEENQVIDYDITYADESTSNRYLASKNYCQDVEKTKYSTISLSRRL